MRVFFLGGRGAECSGVALGSGEKISEARESRLRFFDSFLRARLSSLAARRASTSEVMSSTELRRLAVAGTGVSGGAAVNGTEPLLRCSVFSVELGVFDDGEPNSGEDLDDGVLFPFDGLGGLPSFFPVPFMAFSSTESDEGASVTGAEVLEACLVLAFLRGVGSSGSLAFGFFVD